MPHVDKNYNPTRGDRVILAILGAFKKKRKKVKRFDTTRSKDISDQLRKAGIGQKKINQMKYNTK
ncbi:hypothetical protein LCGC14_2186360 [marine sediment metagenome]|uniref:Uncharacterized protein n=1 Tax=marine sediment metagenome TaxID=412755 RepID=A0A0F9DKV1_9ZZZZ